MCVQYKHVLSECIRRVISQELNAKPDNHWVIVGVAKTTFLPGNSNPDVENKSDIFYTSPQTRGFSLQLELRRFFV